LVHGEDGIALETRPLRWAGAAMLTAGVARPLIAHGGAGVPCPLRSLTGVPCPFCGMTRGVTAVVHGNVAGAALFNPGSVLIVVAAVLLLAMWRVRRVTIPTWLPVAMIAALWVFELFKYESGLPL
jgi:Protein of unknown function (DUF2752)